MMCSILLSSVLLFSTAVTSAAVAPAQIKKKVKKTVPPGLAKKGGLPPGLAKKFGPQIPLQPYIAFDPTHTDRAWFLIEGQWQLKTGLTGTLRIEIQDSLKLPVAPPPVPLPKVGVALHVVLFE